MKTTIVQYTIKGLTKKNYREIQNYLFKKVAEEPKSEYTMEILKK